MGWDEQRVNLGFLGAVHRFGHDPIAVGAF